MWRSAKLWDSRYIDNASEKNTTGHLVIVGEENLLGERRIFYIKEALPRNIANYYPPMSHNHWREALLWKHEIRQ